MRLVCAGPIRRRCGSGVKRLCRKWQSHCVCVCAAMKRPALLLLCFLCCQTDTFHTRGDADSSGNSSCLLDVDLSAAIRRVDRRYLSVTIDASLAQEEKFMYLLRWVSVRLGCDISALNEAAVSLSVLLVHQILLMCSDPQLTSL